MTKKQIKLTESELRQIVQEAIQQHLNEDNVLTRLWNNKKINSCKYWANKYLQDGDLDSAQVYVNFLRRYDKRSAQQFQNEIDNARYEANNQYEEAPQEQNDSLFSNEFGTIDPNSQPGEPYDYNPYPQNNQPQAEEQSIEPGETATYESEPQTVEAPEEPAQTEEQPAETLESQPQAEPEPEQSAAPAYQRGQKYGLNFSQENEQVIKSVIGPAYDCMAKAVNYLYQLEQLGPAKYNSIATGFNDKNNRYGGTQDYLTVRNQINQILPSLRFLRSNMKNIMYANGFRTSNDYQQYGIEESKIRKIVHNSLQKILKENLTKH